ncbi:MAG: saccharopine dehydrogenase NADP-binding domain-containing protein [Gammaproteobacteria bacterium]|nr:saccharopine dehydrogenase NADP-binding domain-containing protein [Gammaproteobacteria bacterium]MBU1414660.1 saccharopine dehydrogenase NADP-binding domain-containing protein [Gammaproteobacteria bacterium]
MPGYRKFAAFEGRLAMVGFGCIGRGVLPLLLRHIGIRPDQIRIVTDHDSHRDVAEAYGIAMRVEAVTPHNYRRIFEEELRPGDFLLNLSINVASVDLIAWCQEHDVLYLDACIEPWDGGYNDPTLTLSQRSNYALREAAMALRKIKGRNGPTAVLTHGVNPGLVSHFVKQALLDVATAVGDTTPEPRDRAGWAALAQRLGVKVIHIAERDTQASAIPKRPGEFVNTWSIEGFAGEGYQPAEIGWGSHERHFPADGRRHSDGCGAAIYLERPGAATRVRSWTPLEGPYHGFLITHGESISVADYLTFKNGEQVVYRPTVHYAYHPCDDAVLSIHELAGKNWQLQARRRELSAEDIVVGMDELGVLLAGHAKNAYWYGSRLTNKEARELCPHNNATSLQTAVGVLGGVVWAMRHPAAGIVDPEEMDFREVLEVALPYLGEMAGVFTDWTPLHGRGELFQEDLDEDDPWQFKNVRV